MSTVKNYDIKTVRKVIGTNPTSLGLGAVPSGMKRWVTFLRADNVYGGINNLYIVSATAETVASTPTLASAAAKDKLQLQNAADIAVPSRGPTDPETPLFSIAEAKYLTALTDKGDTNVMIQYYDE